MERMITSSSAMGLDNLPDARMIRQEVFVEEQGFVREFDETDAAACHVVLLEDGVPAATGRTFPSGETGVYTIGRVAVRKPWRGSGLGRRVIEELEACAQDAGARELVLSAQCQARGFYEKLGYAACGEIYLDEGCPHIAMYKRISD